MNTSDHYLNCVDFILERSEVFQVRSVNLLTNQTYLNGMMMKGLKALPLASMLECICHYCVGEWKYILLLATDFYA